MADEVTTDSFEWHRQSKMILTMILSTCNVMSMNPYEPPQSDKKPHPPTPANIKVGLFYMWLAIVGGVGVLMYAAFIWKS